MLGDERMVEAVRALRCGDGAPLDQLLAEHVRRAFGPSATVAAPRRSGPEGAAGDSESAWADRVVRLIFDFVGAARWNEAHLVATAAVTAFSELDDETELARMLASAAVTGLGVGQLNDAFDMAVRAMVHLWSGELTPAAASSTANNLGTFFERLGAWDLAHDQFEIALTQLDPATPTGGPRAQLTIENLTFCLHQTLDSDCPEERGRVAHVVDRLQEMRAQLAATPTTSHGGIVALFLELTLALAERRSDDAVALGLQLAERRDGMVMREELALCSMTATAMWRAGHLRAAERWSSDALSLARQSDDFRVPDPLRLRAKVRWALGEQELAFADAMAASDEIAATRSARIVGLAAGLADRARLELLRRELTDASASLAITASCDPLTGLANRRGLDEAMSQLAQARHGASVLVVDIDRFKSVNDGHGHAVGDQVIKTIAEVLRLSVRGDGALVRLGGDEFVVVLPDLRERPEELGEEICAAVRRFEWQRLAEGLKVTVSVGVAVGAANDIREIMGRADAALYDAKRAGRDAVRVVDRRRSPRVSGPAALSALGLLP